MRRQVPVSIIHEGRQYDEGFVADLIVADKVLLELKSIESINNAHKKQFLTYLKLTNIKLGYILNFSGELMKHGILRCINGDISTPSTLNNS